MEPADVATTDAEPADVTAAGAGKSAGLEVVTGRSPGAPGENATPAADEVTTKLSAIHFEQPPAPAPATARPSDPDMTVRLSAAPADDAGNQTVRLDLASCDGAQRYAKPRGGQQTPSQQVSSQQVPSQPGADDADQTTELRRD